MPTIGRLIGGIVTLGLRCSPNTSSSKAAARVPREGSTSVLVVRHGGGISPNAMADGGSNILIAPTSARTRARVRAARKAQAVLRRSMGATSSAAVTRLTRVSASANLRPTHGVYPRRIRLAARSFQGAVTVCLGLGGAPIAASASTLRRAQIASRSYLYVAMGSSVPASGSIFNSTPSYNFPAAAIRSRLAGTAGRLPVRIRAISQTRNAYGNL